MPAPNSTYVYMSPLQQQLVDKLTGLALANGVVSFFRDANRTVPKNVYQQTGSPGSYTYTVLGVNGVLTLSSVGTFVDGSGNNVEVFLWPYEGDPTSPPSPLVPDPYYITVTSEAPDLILQFTVANWPPNLSQTASSTGAVNSFNLLKYTSGSATYTPSPNLVYAVIECMGGGGGGGGTPNSGAGGIITGGGGGAGGYSRKTATLAQLMPSQLVTVGTGGAGGDTSTFTGGNGTASAVGSICIANGGSGGAVQSPGAGASAGTGDIAAPGAPGMGGDGAITASNNFPSGGGASTQWGGGGYPVNSTLPGNAGTGYGSGGSGGESTNAESASIGGAGAPGVVIITEYISS